LLHNVDEYVINDLDGCVNFSNFETFSVYYSGFRINFRITVIVSVTECQWLIVQVTYNGVCCNTCH